MEKDFFISYTSSDADWAEWIAWQLEEANYSTILQAWDFSPGSNFVIAMDRATKAAKQTVAVISPSYLERLFTQAEWAAAFAQDPLGDTRRLLPVRIKECDIEGLLAQVVYIDLSNLSEKDAKRRLLEGVGGRRSKPPLAPNFPGRAPSSRPATFPGSDLKQHHLENNFTIRSFVCAKVTASGLLDLEIPANPYEDALDPTDQTTPGARHRAFIVYWLPTGEAISRAGQGLTPAVAICTLDPEGIIKRFEHKSRSVTALLTEKPRDMRDDVRENLLETIAESLRDSFVAIVTIPSIVLGAGRRNPLIAYQAIMNLLLFPLIEIHRRLGFQELRVWLTDTGKLEDKILKTAKSGAKALFPARQSIIVDLVSRNDFWLPFAHAARLLAWTATNPKWLKILKEKLEAADQN